ncbi:MAG: sigma-70 family RNA polymerase sigma factor [Flavobacteriales bacterium]|jgi:RNA polymerase sigma factor (sigma-70 family)|nr:sigma-70 family RNA polymerase sigma factor [Flavobacteriales bacterium]
MKWVRPDRSLLDRCIRKDRAAQFELFKLLYDLLMSVARRYEPDAQLQKALMNTAYLRILDNLHAWQPFAPFDAWCRRVAVNTAINDYRAKASVARTVSLEPFHETSANTIPNEVEEAIEAEELQRLVDDLPEMSRRVFNLYAVDGWKHREIAAELGISEGTSKWHVSHARQQLQLRIAEQYSALVIIPSTT